MKNPRKWDDPNNPSSVLENPSCKPESTSRGEIAPALSCNKATDSIRAAKEMRRRMGRDSYTTV
jgi:hypothetical protein